jgi:hypothetical protein
MRWAPIVCSVGAFGSELLCEGLERFRSKSGFEELLKSLWIVNRVQCLTDPRRTGPMPDLQGPLYSRPEGA